MKLKLYIKRKITELIRSLGYDIKSIKKTISSNDFDSIIKYLLKDKKKHIYFDIGANLGDSIERFKKINKDSVIHSFEPTPELFDKIKEKYGFDKNLIINNIGVTDTKGKAEFYSYKYHRINSVVQVEKNSKFAKARVLSVKANKENFENTIDISTTSIDIYCDENNINEIDFIKIDIQGGEEKCLQGMQKLLSKEKASIIELELIIGFGYKKNFSFYDYEKHLNKHNYKLIALSSPGNVISYSNYQTNLLYVKSEIFENIRQLHEKNIAVSNVTNRTDESHPLSY